LVWIQASVANQKSQSSRPKTSQPTRRREGKERTAGPYALIPQPPPPPLERARSFPALARQRRPEAKKPRACPRAAGGRRPRQGRKLGAALRWCGHGGRGRVARTSSSTSPAATTLHLAHSWSSAALKGGGSRWRTACAAHQANPMAAAPTSGPPSVQPGSGMVAKTTGALSVRPRAPLLRPLPPPWSHARRCAAFAGRRRPQDSSPHAHVHHARGHRPRLGRPHGGAQLWRGGGGRRLVARTPAGTTPAAAAPALDARTEVGSSATAAAAAR